MCLRILYLRAVVWQRSCSFLSVRAKDVSASGKQPVSVHAVVVHKVCQPAYLKDLALRILAQLIQVSAIDVMSVREVRESMNHSVVFERIEREKESAHNGSGIYCLHISSDLAIAAANFASKAEE